MRRTISKISATRKGASPRLGSSSISSFGCVIRRAADRQHLLLAARQVARLRGAALVQPREVAVDPVAVAHACRRACRAPPTRRPGSRPASGARTRAGLRARARCRAGRASAAAAASMLWPRNCSSPRVDLRRARRFSSPLTAFSVVLLPAPFAPSSATMPPCGTSIDDALDRERDVVVDDLDVVQRQDVSGAARWSLTCGRSRTARPAGSCARSRTACRGPSARSAGTRMISAP